MLPETPEQTNEELILSFLAEGGDDFISGEALSGKLGLSRTAVWKHVNSLRHKGYRIDAVPARGYRLVEVPDRLTALELTPLLSTQELGRVIHAFDSCTSTNELAFKLAAAGACHGEIVVAEEQTHGKGRRGRTWASPSGLNLYFSMVLRPDLPPQRASEITLLAAVALAETIRDAGAQAQIKWPNDVQIEGKKVAGILTELSADADSVKFVILGVGVNLNGSSRDLPEDVAPNATSVAEARGERVPRALFAAALWTRLEHWFDLHAEQGFPPVRAAWKKLSATLGQDVLVKAERQELRGRAVDIDESGALILDVGDGKTERVLAGDVEQLRAKK